MCKTSQMFSHTNLHIRSLRPWLGSPLQRCMSEHPVSAASVAQCCHRSQSRPSERSLNIQVGGQRYFLFLWLDNVVRIETSGKRKRGSEKGEGGNQKRAGDMINRDGLLFVTHCKSISHPDDTTTVLLLVTITSQETSFQHYHGERQVITSRLKLNYFFLHSVLRCHSLSSLLLCTQ